MNQTELLARVRRNAFIPSTHPTYTDQIILDELNDALRSIYEDLVTIPRQGHWLKQLTFNSTVGQAMTRIPPRAVIGGIEKIEIGPVNGVLQALDQVTENHAQLYESFGGQLGTPMYYCIRGDQIEFLPNFDSVQTVRISYYLKPNLLVMPQPIPANPASGTVSSKSVLNRTVTVTSQPVYRTGDNSGTVISNFAALDIVHTSGTCEVALVGAIATSYNAGSTTYTFPVGTDLSEVVSLSEDFLYPDIVRGAGETDYPALPEEFHRTVADAAAVKILLQLNNVPKASSIASSVGGDIERLRKLIEAPRTRRQPKRVGARLMTRSGGMPWSRWR